MTTKKATDLTFRVLKLSQLLRQAIRKARDAKGVTNEQFVQSAVDEQLPVLVEQLRDLGFAAPRGKIVAARFPFSDTAKTLESLRRASNQVQIPAIRLLEICLASAVSARTPGRSKRKGGRRTPRKTQRKQKRTHTPKEE